MQTNAHAHCSPPFQDLWRQSIRLIEDPLSSASQHVNHFQLQTNDTLTNGKIWRAGDWRDTVTVWNDSPALWRFRYSEFAGPMIVCRHSLCAETAEVALFFVVRLYVVTPSAQYVRGRALFGCAPTHWKTCSWNLLRAMMFVLS